MANINIEAAINRADADLQKALGQIPHSGISARDALRISNTAAGIAIMAARIDAEARAVMGDRSAGSLVKKIRKALGFTYP